MTARNGTGTVVVPLQELLEAMTDGVLITDESGRSTYSNPALDEIVGGKACDPSFGEEAPEWMSIPQGRISPSHHRALNGRIPRRPQSVTWELLSIDGDLKSHQHQDHPHGQRQRAIGSIAVDLQPRPRRGTGNPGSTQARARRCHATDLRRTRQDWSQRQHYSRGANPDHPDLDSCHDGSETL